MNTATTIEFLRENKEKHFIRLTDLSNDSSLGKQNIFLNEIPGEDLVKYIHDLAPKDRNTEIWVEHRSIQGNTNVKKGISYKIRCQNEPIKTQEPVNLSTGPGVNYPMVQKATNYPENVNHQQQPFLGNPFASMNAPEILKHMRNSDKVEDLKEALDERKQKCKKLQQKYDIIDLENRELKSKLAVAEQQKDVAVTLAKMENKSWLDSPAIEKLLEKAPEVLANLSEFRNGKAPQTTGLNAPDLSETKSDFVSFLKDFSDEQVNYLGSILATMDNEQFMIELQQLIMKYNG